MTCAPLAITSSTFRPSLSGRSVARMDAAMSLREPLHSPSFYGAMKFLNQFPSKLVSKSQQGVCFMGRFVAPEAHFRRAETLRPECDQPVAVLVEVNQCKGSQQPFVILLQTAIAHLGISEDALQDAEGPLHL